MSLLSSSFTEDYFHYASVSFISGCNLKTPVIKFLQSFTFMTDRICLSRGGGAKIVFQVVFLKAEIWIMYVV